LGSRAFSRDPRDQPYVALQQRLLDALLSRVRREQAVANWQVVAARLAVEHRGLHSLRTCLTSTGACA
jgi:hypothetical protein